MASTSLPSLLTTSANSGEINATQSFLCAAILMSCSATVADASPAARRPISISSVLRNLLKPVILSPSETSVPSTPPIKLSETIVPFA